MVIQRLEAAADILDLYDTVTGTPGKIRRDG
jgi:hypothetical protein